MGHSSGIGILDAKLEQDLSEAIDFKSHQSRIPKHVSNPLSLFLGRKASLCRICQFYVPIDNNRHVISATRTGLEDNKALIAKTLGRKHVQVFKRISNCITSYQGRLCILSHVW